MANHHNQGGISVSFTYSPYKGERNRVYHHNAPSVDHQLAEFEAKQRKLNEETQRLIDKLPYRNAYQEFKVKYRDKPEKIRDLEYVEEDERSHWTNQDEETQGALFALRRERIDNIRSNLDERLQSYPSDRKYQELGHRAMEYVHESVEFLEQRYPDTQESMNSISCAEMILDVLTAYTPGVSLFRDAYEAFLGKDLITGEILGSFARSMAVLGLASVGIIKPRMVILGVEKLASLIKKADDSVAVRGLLWGKSLTELKDTVGFFKKHKIYDMTDENAVNVANAFMKGAKTKVLTEDTKVYRYYMPGKTEAKGAWVSPNIVKDPEVELALRSGPYQVKEWTIPKGTEVLEGIAAPNFSKKGGAMQIIVNKELLR